MVGGIVRYQELPALNWSSVYEADGVRISPTDPEGIRTPGGLLGRYIALSRVAPRTAREAKGVQLSSRQMGPSAWRHDHLGPGGTGEEVVASMPSQVQRNGWDLRPIWGSPSRSILARRRLPNLQSSIANALISTFRDRRASSIARLQYSSYDR